MFHDSVLHSLRGRPRRKEFGDPFFGNPELFHLVGFFLLHNGEDKAGGQFFLFRSAPQINGLGMGGSAFHGLPFPGTA